MKRAWLVVCVGIVIFLPCLAVADAPLIHCAGAGCGGGGPTTYAYDIDSASYPMMAFRVGTNDLDPANYTRVLIPPGWSFSIEETPMSHAHGVQTPHGEVSPGPCWCLTAGSVRWWTDDPAYAIEFFVFGYDHPWTAEDVGWILSTRREGSPPETYDFQPFWDAPVGTGMGPVHGPYEPVECPDDDGDGYTASWCGGTDCDDIDPRVNPGVNERGHPLCEDGIDNDCDGLIDCDDEECACCFINMAM